jgi:hypothetical protein
VSFYPFSQDEYLAIVAQWLSALGASAAQIEAARPEALVWALERGSRSGRVAYVRARLHGARGGGVTGEPIRADAHLPRQDGGARAAVEVAVGVLIRPDGRLLTSRPPGKVYAGYWEFPGGKLEPGERGAGAARELHEELGVTLDPAAITRWREQLVDYPHALVRLHWCR